MMPTLTVEQAHVFLRMLTPKGSILHTRIPPQRENALAVCLTMPAGNSMVINSIVATRLQREVWGDGLVHLTKGETTQSIIELLGGLCHGTSAAFTRVDY